MFIGISTAPTRHIPALEVSDTGVSVENQGQRDPGQSALCIFFFSILGRSKSFRLRVILDYI